MFGLSDEVVVAASVVIVPTVGFKVFEVNTVVEVDVVFDVFFNAFDVSTVGVVSSTEIFDFV